MNKEKFFEAVNKRRGKTNLKANKVQLGAIDDIYDGIDRMDWDNKLQSVYDIYREANDFAESIKNNAYSEYETLESNMSFLENALKDLGVEPMTSVIDGRNELDRIKTQIDGLEDDISSGVLV